MANLVLVERLLESYDPWSRLGIKPISWEKIQAYQYVKTPESSVKTWQETEDKTTYDYGRIRFLADEMTFGWQPDPIEIDNYCANGYVYPAIVVIDGHHRLCAADLVGLERIKISYGGRVDLLRWLQGKRKTRPE